MASLRDKGIGPAALEALGSVPRETFVSPDQRGRAYEDRPVAIGLGQTCSQPWIVAVVVQALDLRPGASVLEVGAGSGATPPRDIPSRDPACGWAAGWGWIGRISR